MEGGRTSTWPGRHDRLTGQAEGPRPCATREARWKEDRTDYAQAKLATLSQFVRYYEDACDVPTQICVAPDLSQLDRQASLLVMLDSAYNYGPQQWLDLFARTGATLAAGVSMLPIELLFADLSHNFGYLYNEVEDHGDGFSVPTGERTTWAEVTWAGGCCDGYRHVKTAWETILKRPVVAGRGVKADGTTEDVVIAFEINNRVGPMAAWTTARVACIEPKVRTIGLRRGQVYRIEDLNAARAEAGLDREPASC